jgi:hypothetical protein
MLEYFKTILKKVSFDKNLFERELRKSIKRLMPNEVQELRIWCYEQFSGRFHTILDRCFLTLA